MILQLAAMLYYIIDLGIKYLNCSDFFPAIGWCDKFKK